LGVRGVSSGRIGSSMLISRIFRWQFRSAYVRLLISSSRCFFIYYYRVVACTMRFSRIT
jgi:hypothetical protein